MKPILILFLSLGLVPALAGCTAEQGAIDGGYGQAGTYNRVDHFGYGVQGSVTGTKTFTWENTKREAAYTVAVQGMGTVKVTIKDPAGKTMVNRDVDVSGQSGKSGIAGSGSPGEWTITLTFTNFNGQGGITVDAR